MLVIETTEAPIGSLDERLVPASGSRAERGTRRGDGADFAIAERAVGGLLDGVGAAGCVPPPARA